MKIYQFILTACISLFSFVFLSFIPHQFQLFSIYPVSTVRAAPPPSVVQTEEMLAVNSLRLSGENVRERINFNWLNDLNQNQRLDNFDLSAKNPEADLTLHPLERLWLSNGDRPAENFAVPAPFFKEIVFYSTTIPGHGDSADIYYPNPTNNTIQSNVLAIALLLPGYNVDKIFYSKFATQLARYGFVVVVPNHLTTVRGEPELFAQVGQIPEVLAFMKAENLNPDSPVYAMLDPQKLVLIGHSHGGFIGMDAIREACDLPFCKGEYSRPKELIAGVFFGADLWENGHYLKIQNQGIPMALIAGSQDSLIRADSIKATYDNIQTSPKAYIKVMGANHYGITDTNNPVGSPLERNRSTLDRNQALETIARWSGLFLRAYAFNDTAAYNYVFFNGDALDENVTVMTQH